MGFCQFEPLSTPVFSPCLPLLSMLFVRQLRIKNTIEVEILSLVAIWFMWAVSLCTFSVKTLLKCNKSNYLLAFNRGRETIIPIVQNF